MLHIDFRAHAPYSNEMALTGTSEQWTRNTQRVKVWRDVPDPTDIGEDEAVERVALDLSGKDLRLYAAYAAYRNKLADEQGKKLTRKWTRKSYMESVIRRDAQMLREQLEEMISACGPLPDPNDEKEMEKYVRRVLAWDKKNGD